MRENTPDPNQKKSTEEDKYVDETYEYLKKSGFGLKIGDHEITPASLRAEYRRGAEYVRDTEHKHLVGLRDVLTPVAARYEEQALQALLATPPETVPIPWPHMGLNLEPLASQILENDAEKAIVDFLEKHPDEVQKYAQGDLEGLSGVLEDMTTNAAFVTDISIKRGKTKVLADIDRLWEEKFGEKIEGTGAQTDFTTSLGLRTSTVMIWGKLYSNPDDKGFHESRLLGIGEYGESHTRKIFSTMQVMLKYALPLEKELKAVGTAHADIFHQTARGEIYAEFGAWLALLEGIETLGQTMNLLTSEKVTGYDEPDILIRDLIEGKLPNQLAHSAPPALIGPLTLVGKYIHGLITSNTDGKPVLNPDIKAKMLAEKKRRFTEKVREALSVDEYHPKLPAVGRGCPVSFGNEESDVTGINRLSDVFLSVFGRLGNRPTTA